MSEEKVLKEVKIRKATSPDGKLRAYVKILTKDNLSISDVKILEIDGKLIVGFPAEKKQYPNGSVKYYPIVRIKNKDLKEKIFKEILDEYRKTTETRTK